MRADLSVLEAKIQARLEKVVGKADKKLLALGATPRARAAEAAPSKASAGRRSKKR